MLRGTYFVAVTVLLVLVSFVITGVAGPAHILVWAVLVGAVSLLFVKLIAHLGVESSEIASMLLAGAVLAGAGLLKWVTHAPSVVWPDAIAVLVGLGTAWGLEIFVAGRGKRPCFICKLPIDERVPFACPRCHQVICTRPSCWIARHFRCKYCDEREVIIFPIDEAWWKTRLGPRVTEGSCNSCYKEAGETDLRACGRCRWTLCRRCWDYHNGLCTHCGWIVPDPPSALRPFLGGRESAEHGRGERDARRQR
jgi:hypothetical protein